MRRAPDDRERHPAQLGRQQVAASGLSDSCGRCRRSRACTWRAPSRARPARSTKAAARMAPGHRRRAAAPSGAHRGSTPAPAAKADLQRQPPAAGRGAEQLQRRSRSARQRARSARRRAAAVGRRRGHLAARTEGRPVVMPRRPAAAGAAARCAAGGGSQASIDADAWTVLQGLLQRPQAAPRRVASCCGRRRRASAGIQVELRQRAHADSAAGGRMSITQPAGAQRRRQAGASRRPADARMREQQLSGQHAGQPPPGKARRRARGKLLASGAPGALAERLSALIAHRVQRPGVGQVGGWARGRSRGNSRGALRSIMVGRLYVLYSLGVSPICKFQASADCLFVNYLCDAGRTMPTAADSTPRRASRAARLQPFLHAPHRHPPRGGLLASEFTLTQSRLLWEPPSAAAPRRANSRAFDPTPAT